ncbi:hypothetical protein [Rhizobium sp. BK602]|uniref:hypothetical protein n=1 Tax=Rhizobium sp. BK602 TaxID=2586986 RepID=UPI001607CA22|nr:hypothetical protein [Rhizobium sp. BK602]MBB3610325.1 hypothetical protein [Rhizobium sp. BK602]
MAPNNQFSSPEIFQRKISDFCTVRLESLLQQRTFENVRAYMIGLVQFRSHPPARAGKIDWQAIALACDMEAELTTEVKRAVQPGFDAIARWLGANRANKMAPVATNALPRRAPSKRLEKTVKSGKPLVPVSPLRKPASALPDRRSIPLVAARTSGR